MEAKKSLILVQKEMSNIIGFLNVATGGEEEMARGLNAVPCVKIQWSAPATATAGIATTNDTPRCRHQSVCAEVALLGGTECR